MPTHNLPQSPTPFVGREYELGAITDHLADPTCRLLTLVGPGGIGKTRLALEVARQIDDAAFPNGIHFVALQPLTSPDFIVSTIADALNLSFFGGQDPRTQLLDYLSEKRLLLIMDNFEHLLEGVELLPEILESDPDVKFLITSRERLRLREEWVFDVSGLAFPDNGHITAVDDYTAVQLFVQTARRAGSAPQATDSAAVVRICQLVEGTPLALELAAAWVRVMPCAEIAREVERSLDILTTTTRNVPEKHRSMRAAFEHSWTLLSEEEQAVFRKLSVFRAGFRREAAEQVAGASLFALCSLVDKSLLRVDASGRYSLQELLRQYGQERLDDLSGDAEQTRDDHCSYYSGFMERQWLRLTGSEIKAALSDISTELDNVRAAWEWAVSQHKAAEIEAALPSLWFFYGVGFRYHEGVQVFARAASAFREHRLVYAKVLARWGELCGLADLPKAKTLLEESLSLLRRVQVPDEIAFVLYRLGSVNARSGMNFPQAAEYLKESLAIYTELDDRYGMGAVLWQLFLLHLVQGVEQALDGAVERAQQCAQECLVAFQQCGSTFGIGLAYLALSEAAQALGDYRQCWGYAQKSLDTCQELGIGWGIVEFLTRMGHATWALGLYTKARSYTLQSLLVDVEHGLTRINAYTLFNLDLAAGILNEQGDKERAYELLAVVDQQRLHFGMGKDRSSFPFLSLLDEDLPAHLAAAVERGRTRDFDTVVSEIIHEFSQSMDSASSLPALPPQPLVEPLNEREMEILQLIADGLKSREVAERLYLSVGTIRWYLKHIYSKLDAHSRTQAIARARQLKLLA